LAALSVALAGPASAHDELVSSSPASGATVAAPTALTLTYSEALVSTGYRVVVRGPGGEVGGDVGLAGTRLVDRFAGPLSAGAYDVLWRVVSADGHPISGRLSFTVRRAATPSPSATATSSGPPATSSSTSSAAAGPPTSTSSTSSAASAPSAPSSGGGRNRLLTVGLIAAVLAAGAALLGARRRGGPPG
jgi:methionine-rich copper-binding protein CopC